MPFIIQFVYMQSSYLYILYYLEFICTCGVVIKRLILQYRFSRTISREDGMVNLILQTWIYAEFIFSLYLYVVNYTCKFNTLVQSTVHIILCAIYMQSSYLYILYYIEFIHRVVVKGSIILFVNGGEFLVARSSISCHSIVHFSRRSIVHFLVVQSSICLVSRLSISHRSILHCRLIFHCRRIVR